MYALSKCDYIIGPKATTMSAWASFTGTSQLLQIDSESKAFILNDFSFIDKLEPFSPLFGKN